MKRRFSAIFLLVFISFTWAFAQSIPGDNLEVRNIPVIPNQLIERTNQFLNIRSASFADWDHSGNGMYILTRFANTAQVHYVSVPGGARQQITFFDEPIGGGASDPRAGKNGFLFVKDVGGGEFYQAFYFDRVTGAYRMLTDGKSRNESIHWSHSGKSIAFSSNRRNKKDTDVWIMDPDSPENARPLTEREGAWYVACWSPDETKLVVNHFVSANESHPYILDIASKELVSLEKEPSQKASYGNFEWSRDRKTIFYTSDIEGEFQSLFAFDVSSKKTKNLSPSVQWDIEELALSKDGKYAAYSVNEDGISVLHVVQLPSMKEISIKGMPVGVISGLRFNPTGKRIAMNINASTGPGDVYSFELKTGTLTRWTMSEVGGLNQSAFVVPKLIHYPTFDQIGGKKRMIPAFYYAPKDGRRNLPVIIDIHGGPEGQSRPYFSSVYQYWVNELGCAIVVPNVRGSTGYGKTYLALDNGFNRENSVKDIGALLDWIEKQPELDPKRVAVIGGSYGGYMVLASLTHYPDRIRCGVDVVGISNFVTFLENTESYRRDLRRVEYGDERDPEMRTFLEKVSPLNNANKIRSALFVAQGENDPRVPASEARQIVNAVEKNAIPVWTMFAKDEGHGFRKKNNRDYYTRAAILFFEQFLLK